MKGLYVLCLAEVDKGLWVGTAADNNGRYQFNQVHGGMFTVEVMCDMIICSLLCRL